MCGWAGHSSRSGLAEARSGLPCAQWVYRASNLLRPWYIPAADLRKKGTELSVAAHIRQVQVVDGVLRNTQSIRADSLQAA